MSALENLAIGARADLLNQIKNSCWIWQRAQIDLVETARHHFRGIDKRLRNFDDNDVMNINF